MKFILIFFLTLFSSSYMAANEHRAIFHVTDAQKSNHKLSFILMSKIFEREVSPSIILSRVEITSDTTYNVIVDNLKEQVYAAIANGNYVLITPNDELNIVVTIDKHSNEQKILFTGKNEENYNFGLTFKPALGDTFRTKLITNLKSEANLIAYIDSNYINQKKLIQEYTKGYKNNKLKQLLLEDENAKRYYYLWAGINELKKKDSNFVVSQDIKDIFFKEKLHNKDSLLLFSRPYTYCLIKAIDVLRTINKQSNENELIKKSEIIDLHFSGMLNQYLQSNNFYYSLRKLKNSPSNQDMVDSWFKKYSPAIKDNSYAFFVNYGYINFRKSNKTFPINVLQTKLFNSKNKQIKLADIISKYNGKFILIDNWASWCGPCIDEISQSKENVSKMKETGVIFIYLALEKQKDVSKMITIATDLGIVEDTYRVFNDFQSEYALYADIKTIPRYILINKQGEVDSFYALRPSNQALLNYISAKNNL